jgi:hypothetical protein
LGIVSILMYKSYFLTTLFWMFVYISFAQKNEEKYQITIKKTSETLKVDGVLDEGAWANADVANNFYLNFPFDSSYSKPEFQTQVKVLFDDTYIYIGAICYQKKEDIIISSLKRDFEGGVSDVFTVNFDTFKDNLNGFQFAVNPYGVQREGLIQGGFEILNYWDNKWYSQAKVHDDYWVVEMAIPFKTLRYKVSEGENTWRINFGRMVLKYNQISTWGPVPRNFSPANLAFAGKLNWAETPPKPGVNVALIPFLSATSTREFPRDEATLQPQKPTSDYFGSIGLDAKIGITPSLNLDLTVNPDFSQVEVDRQQTNLSRFELFFPERRQFFLENSDLLGMFGFENTRPFFSRRIGITRNPRTGMAQRVPIMAGARLSGKLNDNWRVGLMNMQTQKVNFGEDAVLPAANYSVGVLQRKLFKRSTIGGVFVNKQFDFKNVTEEQSGSFDRFNRVGGLELNLNSNDSRFESETYYHQSFQPERKNDAGSFAHYMGYNHPNFEIGMGAVRVGENYRADVGYVPRTGIWDFYRPITLILNPKSKNVSKKINAYGFGIKGADVLNLKGKLLDSENELFVFVNNANGAELYAFFGMSFTHLFETFDPTNASDNPNPDRYRNVMELPVGDYRYFYQGVGFESSLRHKLYGFADYKWGNYFNGKGQFAAVSLTYRLQPYGTLSLDGEFSKIDLPLPYNSVKYWLLGPRAEMAFSKRVFTSLFFQYNSQTNNTNINARFQWRFKPVSDFFLVYTENYFAEAIPNYRVNAWAPKDRAITLKMTYWLNL